MHRLRLSALVSATLAGIVSMLAATHAQNTSGLPLIGPTDLSYLGSFRVPSSDGAGGDLSYGQSLGMGPRGDSLWWRSQAGAQHVAEVSIPPIGGYSTVLQPAHDLFEGRRGLISPGADGIEVGGVLSWNGRVVASAYSFYDANGVAEASHVASGANLAITGDVLGPVRVGTDVPVGMTAGYMGVIPAEWQGAFGGGAVTGQCCISIIWRTSSGPSLFVFNPDDVGRVSPVPAQPLVYYPLSHELAPGTQQNAVFNQSTAMAGMAFPAGTRSVLFFGRHGLGPYCYGTGGGIDPVCYDPSNGHNAPHAYPYIHQVWAYDALDLLKVQRGELPPWEPRPYATWRLPEMNNDGWAGLAGMAYDPATRRVYMAQPNLGGDQIVHVYQIAGEGVTPAPTTPAGLPGAPAKLTAVVNGSQVELSWLPPVGGGTPSSYIVEAGTSPGSEMFRHTVGDQYIARFDGVAAGRYYVRVRAANASGTGAASNEVVIDVGCQGAANVPPELSSSIDGSTVTVSWTGQSCGDTKYEVAIGSTPGASDLAQLTTTERAITGPATPGVYFVRVTAVSSSGMRATSQELRVAIGQVACAPLPALVLTSDVSGPFVTIDWAPSAPGDGLTYTLDVGSSPGASNIGRHNAGSATRFTVPVKPGTYYARTTVQNLCGSTGVSNEVVVEVR